MLIISQLDNLDDSVPPATGMSVIIRNFLMGKQYDTFTG